MIEFRAKDKRKSALNPPDQSKWSEIVMDGPPEKHWFDYHIFCIDGDVYTRFSAEFVEAWDRAVMWQKLNA